MQLNFKKIGEGRPLLILHGLFGSLDNWTTIAKKLAENFEVFTIDSRNHGKSPHSTDFNYEIMADDLYEFLITHQIIDPIILGHSMGGKTAMQFAMNYPTHLSQLIVVDIGPKAYPIHHHKILEGLLSMDFDVITTRKEADNQLAKFISDISTRQFLLKNLYWKEKERLAWRFNLDVINNNIGIVGEELRYTTPFQKSTFFIRGGKSNYIMNADFQSIKKIFTRSDIKTIKDSGHWIHAENPNEFVSFIQDFLLSV